MTIQEFIEKAVQGGWRPNPTEKYYDNSYEACVTRHLKHVLEMMAVLDPLAWQAVGKVVPWDESYFHNEARDPYYELGYDPAEDAWKMNMHRMIDALADGKTIEDYLSTL